MAVALHPPLVPGGWTAEAPRREEGARARGDPEGLRGEQQLHQECQRKTGAEDGGHQGEQGGSAGCHVGEAAGKGQEGLNKDQKSVGNIEDHICHLATESQQQYRNVNKL